jgi:hypothetical protein
MRARQTERRQTEVIGEILPGGLYDTQRVLEHLGIGDSKLMELRKAGVLRAYRLPGYARNWFKGEDIIAMFEPVEA